MKWVEEYYPGNVFKSNASFLVSAEELKAARDNRGILAPAPQQWTKSQIADFNAVIFDTLNNEILDKESLLVYIGQLHRYGGEYYMRLAKSAREYLYSTYVLATGPCPCYESE